MVATSNIRGPTPGHNTQHVYNIKTASTTSKNNVCNIKNVLKVVATSATFENK
jgi:hypothetical protein